MLIFTHLFKIKKQYAIIKNDAIKITKKWSFKNCNAETILFKDDALHIKNNTTIENTYLQINTGLNFKDDFLIDSIFEIENKNTPGFFGIIWGIDKKVEPSNRFSLSTNKKEDFFITCHSGEKAERNKTRQHNIRQPKKKMENRLTIIKLGDFYYFMINKKIVNIMICSNFTIDSPLAGVYVAPGINLKVKLFVVKKIIATDTDAIAGLNLLLD